MDSKLIIDILTAFILLVGLFIILFAILLGLKPVVELRERNKHELNLRELDLEYDYQSEDSFLPCDSCEEGGERAEEELLNLKNELNEIKENIPNEIKSVNAYADNIKILFTRELSSILDRLEKLELKNDGVKNPKLDIDESNDDDFDLDI